LDHLILPLLSSQQTAILKEDGFYGKYTLFGPGAAAAAAEEAQEEGEEGEAKEGTRRQTQTCHRTQAALRLLTLPHRRYAAFVSGSDDGTPEQGIVNKYLANLLKKCERQIMDKVEEVEGLEVGSDGDGTVSKEQKDVLMRRWVQIRELVNGAVGALEGRA
jgi:hypothetical protein